MSTPDSTNNQPQMLPTCTAIAIAMAADFTAHLQLDSTLPFHALASIHFTVADVAFTALCALAWLHFAALSGVYASSASLLSRAWRVLLCSLAIALLLGLYICYRQKSFSLGPELLIFLSVAFALGLATLMISRAFERPKRVLIFGSGRLASRAWREIRTKHRLSRTLMGFVDTSARAEMPPDIADRYIGDLESLPELIVAGAVEELIVAVPLRSRFDSMLRASAIAQALGTRVLGLREFGDFRYAEPFSESAEAFVELAPPPNLLGFKQELKRSLDLVLAATGVLIGLPAFVLIVLCSKLSSSGPVLRRKQVLGFRRKPFQMLDFTFSRGTVLRHSGIRHLPRLLNVLRGDMSLVGPPPLARGDVDGTDLATLVAYFNVRPGMFYKRVSTRRVDDPERQSVGSEYVSHWSLLGDLKVLLEAITFELKVAQAAGAEADAL